MKIFAAVPLVGTRMYDMAVKMGALEALHGEVVVDWRYSQIKSEEWTPKDISVLRAYEWDRINFAPDRIEKVAEIWGISFEELREIRKKQEILSFCNSFDFLTPHKNLLVESGTGSLPKS